MRKRLVMAIVEAKMPAHAAGHRCATMGWLEGFRKLGWDVWIIEDIAAAACIDAAGAPCPPETSLNKAAWEEFVRLFGYEERSTLFVDGSPLFAAGGAPGAGGFRSFAEGADLFVNYSGQFHRFELLDGVKAKAYLDVDPAYTQVWSADYGCDMNLDGHDLFITVGATMDQPGNPVPTCGRRWVPTLPPASVSLFAPAPPAPEPRPWTTIAHWYSGKEVTTQGMKLHPKHVSFDELVGLPGLVPSRIEVACDLLPDWHDYKKFQGAGWRFRDVRDVCATMESYRAFIAGSAGELGVAKGGYVAARTGWMSDRSMVYLASGRPVITMDTGWTALVGEHAGLRAFSTPADAARCISDIEADYAPACASARRLAETVFAEEKVVGRLLDRLGLD